MDRSRQDSQLHELDFFVGCVGVGEVEFEQNLGTVLSGHGDGLVGNLETGCVSRSE